MGIRVFSKQKSIGIADLLEEDQVLFLSALTRDEAIEKLIDALGSKGKLFDKMAFHHAILEREKIVSTGVGLGVAIPHAKLSGFNEFFLIVGIQTGGKGIEWQAIDDQPVRLIFLIGGPDNRQMDYLKILSSLTAMIKDSKKRHLLVGAESAKEFVEICLR